MADFNGLKAKYFYYFFSTKFYERAMSMTAKATVDSVRLEMISDMNIKYPENEVEQQKISSLLTNIDNLITLHQRKLHIKIYSWEQRKLADIGNIITGTTPSTSDESNYNGDYLFVSPVDINLNRYIEKTNTTLSKKGFESGRILNEGSVLFVSIGSTIGKVAQTKEKTTTNQQINAIEVNEKNNNNFIYSLLEKHSNNIRAGASTQAVPILNKTSFSLLEFDMPKIIEQERIGLLFENIDNLITLHQRKLVKLQNIKSSLLEKMFPKNSSNIPEIRFKGFTDDWEQRKLEEISNRFDNLRIPVAANVREKGTIPYYGANGIQDHVKGYTHNGEFVLIAEDGANDLKNYPVKYVNGLFWANNHVHVIQGKKEICDNKYLKYCFSKTNIEALLVGGGRAKLNANIMMGIELKLCQFDEQFKIGELFNNIDNLITLHQH